MPCVRRPSFSSKSLAQYCGCSLASEDGSSEKLCPSRGCGKCADCLKMRLTTKLLFSAATFVVTPNACIKNNNNKVLTGVSLEECEVGCLQATTFQCRAFEYNAGTKACQMTVLQSDSSYFSHPCYSR